MKTTTTFPSSSRVAVAVGALLAALPLAVSAQDTLRTAAQRPRVHVVQPGETLWGLAQLYLGDPLLWPEIYRLNTMVVEDPHWIFPGEELRLAEGEVAAAVPPEAAAAPQEERPPTLVPGIPGPPPDTAQAREGLVPVEQPPPPPPEAPPPPPPPADPGAPTIFAQARRGGLAVTEAMGGEVYRYRAVRRGQFYSAGFLTEGAAIPWAQVLGDASEPPVARTAATSSAVIYQEVEIRAPEGTVYQVGDSLLSASLAREVPGWGQVVVPTAILVVTHVSGDRLLARVVSQFRRVTDGQVAMPLEKFRDPGTVEPRPVQDGMTARVIDVRDPHPVPNVQDVVFIDAGREQGVVPGDVFEVIGPSPTPGAPPVAYATLQIVHTRERSASGLVVQISRPGIRPGQAVRLIRKMPQ
ncbi:hypothetical protein HRbin33_01870 [bacterium HR33]|nr:hypothetical protein HRbin33_01870 [bacterium HR33]